MDPVDGNAVGGLLIDAFGTEMTAASTTCGTCGSIRPVAELVVYQRAPGAVVRCRTCGSVLMVLVRRTHAIGVDLSGLASLSQPGRDSERITMSDKQSMSMPEHPREESMSMGQPEQDAMSMGEPDQGSMPMGQPDEDPE